MNLTLLVASSSAALALLASPVARATEQDRGAAGSAPVVKAAPQVVELAVTEQGTQPSTAVLKVGQPVKLVVTRKTASTCVTQVVNKELGIDRPLPLGQAVTIEVTPAKAGSYRLVCGMGMEFATLKVQ